MKNWFLLVILGLLVLALISFLLFKEKITNNLVNLFKEKPGTCLILKEKYCKTGEAVYSDNKELLGVKYKIPNGAKIFSPIDGKYNRGVVEGKDGQKHEKGYLIFNSNDKTNSIEGKDKYWYEFMLKDIKSNKKVEKGIFMVKKGNILGQMETNNLTDFNFFVVARNGIFDGVVTKQIVNKEAIQIITSIKLK